MKLRKEQTEESFAWKEFHLDPASGKKVILSDAKDGVEEIPAHETIRICLRYLRVKEIHDMQTSVYNINAEIKSRRSGKVTSNFNYALYMEQKMLTAITAWENIEDEQGNLADISVDNIRLLPGWVGAEIVEAIDEMNDLGIEMLSD